MPVPIARAAPLDARALLGFLAARAVPGVEAVDGTTYRRALGGAVAEVRFGGAGFAGVGHRRPGAGSPPAARLLPGGDARLARTLIGDDAEVLAAGAHLGAHPALGPLVRRAPGLRVPGHPDGAELAVRAVLGQQVSVAGARTLAGRLVAAHGVLLRRPAGGVTHAFPSSAVLAGLDPASLPMPRARARALVGLCAALAEGRVHLRSGTEPARARAQLLELAGIGPWTADYVRMRALRDPDVLLVGDLGVRHALTALGLDVSGRALRRLAAEVSPWGSYATVHLWHGG